MIKNSKQYNVTEEQVNNLKKLLEKLEKDCKNLDADIFELRSEALKSQIDELNDEMMTFNALKSGKIRIVKRNSISQLHEVLIGARLAKNWSQKDLADRIGIHDQQIQRYESSDYQSASWARILEVIDALGISINTDNIVLSEFSFNLPTGISEQTINLSKEKVYEQKSLLKFCNI